MADHFERLQSALPEHYVIERELGRGGMATVYLAEDRKHHRQVAVKVLHPDLASILGRTRFLREIEIAASLVHPGIVPLFDSGVTEDVTYYVMPYVEGESLRERLDREKQLPLESALQIAREVGDALAHAHAHQIVHRDIKPANILISGGHALVADFGIARAVTAAAGEQITTSGLAVGTPAYMSPEQASAKDPVDQRTDVYALGCVVYEMLAGEPPFTGATAQAVLARHRLERPPSLEVVRPGVGHGVQHVVDKALAKAPADRYQTVEEFLAALQQAAVSPESGEYRPAPTTWGRWRLAAGSGALLVVAAVVAWIWKPWIPNAPLDPNKIVVFPLQEQGAGSTPGAGASAAVMIAAALETAEPLKVIDAWTWLAPEQRRDAALITANDLDRIARDRRARYALDGSLLRLGDSVRVALRLLDLQGDSVLPQVSTAGLFHTDSIPYIALRAIALLLPRLITPGRSVDVAVLSQRRPAAITSWLQGEVDYRESKFKAALGHYQHALELDSEMVFAALKGTQAANWDHRDDSALVLVDLALRRAAGLPAKYRQFADGLRAYLSGSPEWALVSFQRVIAADSGWTEAWMALGEVYYHYLLAEATPDSLAQLAFEHARRLDPGFAPALFHLGQIAVRSGQPGNAESLLRAFRAARPDTSWIIELGLTVGCRRGGPDRVDWSGAVRAAPGAAMQAARSLAVGGTSPACAERGWRAVLAGAPLDSAASRWGALVGLQSLLVAQGRDREVPALLKYGLDSVHLATNGLYVVDAAAGVGTDSGAAQVIAGLAGGRNGIERASSKRLWYFGVWAWHRGDAAGLAAVVEALGKRVLENGLPADSLIRDAMEARLAVLRADTTRALALLGALRPRGTAADIGWDFWAPIAEERILLARLLLARGRYAEALRLAGVFDSQQPVAYVLYLAPSLQVRLRASEALGRTRDAARFRERLLALGRQDLL